MKCKSKMVYYLPEYCLILVKNVKSDTKSNSPKTHDITFLPLRMHLFDNQYIAKTMVAQV